MNFPLIQNTRSYKATYTMDPGLYVLVKTDEEYTKRK